MDEELFGFMLFVVLVLSCIMTGVVFGIRRVMRIMKIDQMLLTQRLDAIRDILRSNGLAAQPPPPGASRARPESVGGVVAAVTAPVRPVAGADNAAPSTGTPAPGGLRTIATVPSTMPPPIPSAPRPAAAPVPPAAPGPASRLAESAREILGKIWNWILVGEEHRPHGVTAEYAVASTWLLRLSIVIIVAGLVYFLKWSVERELVGPAARVGMVLLAGVGMVVAGLRMLGRKYHLIGQGLLGGGLLALYFSAYASGPLYHLFAGQSVPLAFAFMALITVAAGVLAVRTNSLLIAILGLAGGFLTPVMLKTDAPNLPAFYSYLLLLNIGVLAVAHCRPWRLLNYLAFLLTYALFLGSMQVYKTQDFPLAMSFLSVFFVIHSSLVYVHNLLKGRSSAVLDIIHLCANAVVFAWAGYWLIREAHGRPYPCFLSLGLAAFYALHVVLFLRRKLVDRTLLTALIALAGVFATWTLPLVLEKESLTIAFSLIAFMFLWLGRRMESRFLETLGHAVYVIVFCRMLAMDLPGQFDWHPSRTLPLADYWKQMADRLWTFGLSIGSVLAAFFLQRRTASRIKTATLSVSEANNIPALVPPSIAAQVFFWFAVLFVFLFAHLELNTMFSYWMPLRLPMLTVLWCAMAVFMLGQYLRGSSTPQAMFVVMCVFLLGAVVKVLAVDLAAWKFSDAWIYSMEYSYLDAGMRLLDFGVVLAFLFSVWGLFVGRSTERNLAPAFGYAGLLMLFLYTTLELNTFLHWKLPGFQSGGLSILWGLFAIAFITGGIWRNVTPLRYLGLLLFAVVAGKIFLWDLRQMVMIYRVIAFLLIGIFLLIGSFAYIRCSRKFTKTTGTPETQP